MFRSFSFSKLVDDDYRRHVQMIVVPLIAGIVSFGMFILNVFTHKTALMYSTLFYSALAFLNAWLEYRFRRIRLPSILLFAVSTFLLFTSFLLYGGTEGFSPIWICAVPPCALLMLGRKNGSVVCGAMFLSVVFFLWTPIGNDLLEYRYTDSFLMRFPLLYIAMFAVSFFFEAVREATYRSLIAVQAQYKELSVKDTLTGVFNRCWFNDTLADILNRPDSRPASLLIADIDGFKAFNDAHGHLFGDEVLRTIAAVLQDISGAACSVCRWGGEEFAVLMERCDEAQMLLWAERFRDAVNQTDIRDKDGCRAAITVSVGGACLTGGVLLGPDELVALADEALYDAKISGRNCVRSRNI